MYKIQQKVQLNYKDNTEMPSVFCLLEKFISTFFSELVTTKKQQILLVVAVYRFTWSTFFFYGVEEHLIVVAKR